MKKSTFTLLLLLLALSCRAQESQTAYNFLRLPVSAHAAALGGDNITLTDDAVMDAMNKVRAVYPNTLRLDFDNALTAQTDVPELTREAARRDSFALFAEFYEKQNGEPMDAEMDAVVRAMLEGGELL